jgi:hypothetical protein
VTTQSNALDVDNGVFALYAGSAVGIPCVPITVYGPVKLAGWSFGKRVIAVRGHRRGHLPSVAADSNVFQNPLCGGRLLV